MNKKQLIGVYIIAMVLFLPATIFAQDTPAVGYEKVIFEKSGDSYSVDVKYPNITDKLLPIDMQQMINVAIEQFVHGLFDGDLKAFTESKWTKEELKGVAGRDLVTIDFEITRLDERFVSIRFEKYSYGIGAAHGLTHIAGFNYDINRLAMVKLSDLFESGSDCLKQLSDYCIYDLNRQLNKEGDIIRGNWIKEGAAPIEENFKEFALSKEALIIYFSDYQVADYASGTQQVAIPFGKLLRLKQVQ